MLLKQKESYQKYPLLRLIKSGEGNFRLKNLMSKYLGLEKQGTMYLPEETRTELRSSLEGIVQNNFNYKKNINIITPSYRLAVKDSEKAFQDWAEKESSGNLIDSISRMLQDKTGVVIFNDEVLKLPNVPGEKHLREIVFYNIQYPIVKATIFSQHRGTGNWSVMTSLGTVFDYSVEIDLSVADKDTLNRFSRKFNPDCDTKVYCYTKEQLQNQQEVNGNSYPGIRVISSVKPSEDITKYHSPISTLRDTLYFMLFKQISKIEEEISEITEDNSNLQGIVRSKKKKESKQVKIQTDETFKATVLSAYWYTEIIVDREIKVSGHWKMQACGPGYCDHRLIFISPYIKNGMRVRSKKELKEIEEA